MGRRKEHLERVRVEAYCWDVFKPVEMVEIDIMEKLDDAFRMASWCQRCIYLMPRMENIAGEYPGLLRPYSYPSPLFIVLSGSICAAQNLALCFILEYACF